MACRYVVNDSSIVLKTHSTASDLTQLHDHYLKGSLRQALNTRFDELMATARPNLAAKTKLLTALQDEQVRVVRAHSRGDLGDCLALTGDPKAFYTQSNADTHRLANQVFFRKLFIDETAQGTPPKAWTMPGGTWDESNCFGPVICGGIEGCS